MAERAMNVFLEEEIVLYLPSLCRRVAGKQGDFGAAVEADQWMDHTEAAISIELH